jgi:hypothetical protein
LQISGAIINQSDHGGVKFVFDTKHRYECKQLAGPLQWRSAAQNAQCRIWGSEGIRQRLFYKQPEFVI